MIVHGEWGSLTQIQTQVHFYIGLIHAGIHCMICNNPRKIMRRVIDGKWDQNKTFWHKTGRF